MRRDRRGVLAGTITTVLLTAWVFAGSLGPGLVLFRDDVQVPEPVWNDAALGLGAGPPRAVPFLGVMATASQLLGAGVGQRVVLIAPMLLAGVGVTVLLRRHGVLACVVAAAAAVWNPYVAERLALGQAPTLLAYGAMPWLAIVGLRLAGGPVRMATRSTLAFLPAAMTPVGAVMGLAVLVPALAVRRSSRQVALAALAGPLVLCLPWLVAAVVGGDAGAGRPDGALAYAASDDTGRGVLVSVATLGGVWTPSAVPGSRDGLLTLVASVLVLAVAGVGAWRAPRRGLLLAAYLVPVGAVALAATGPVVGWFADSMQVPGVALLRDTHRLLAPAVLAVAVGLGLAIEQLNTARVRAAGAALALVAGVLLTVPDLPAMVRSAYQPGRPPTDWTAAIAEVDSSGGPALSMPWQPLRRTAWNHGLVFQDPVSRGIRAPVLASRALVVERDGRVLRTDFDTDPSAAAWSRGDLDPKDLAARGIRWVLEAKGTVGEPVRATPGLTVVRDGPSMRVWQVADRPAQAPASTGPRWLLVLAWLLAGLLVVGLGLCLLVEGATRTFNRLPQGLRKTRTSR